MIKPDAASGHLAFQPDTTEGAATVGPAARSGAASPLPFRVVVSLGDREVLAYEGTAATITRLSLADHGRLVHTLAVALNVATLHRPEPSPLVEALQSVEALAESGNPATACDALVSVRTAIDDARESLAEDQPPALLN